MQHVVRPEANAERVDYDGKFLRGHAERVLVDQCRTLDDDLLQGFSHLVRTAGERTAEVLVARRMCEELEVEGAPLGVPDHRFERLPGGEFRLLGGAGDVVAAGAEHLADVACALGAATVEELEEQLLLVGEVVVDSAAAEAGLLRDGVEAGCVEAVLGEDARGRRQDLLPGLLPPLGLRLALAFHTRM